MSDFEPHPRDQATSVSLQHVLKTVDQRPKNCFRKRNDSFNAMHNDNANISLILTKNLT